MFPEKTKASFIGQIPLPVRKSMKGKQEVFLSCFNRECLLAGLRTEAADLLVMPFPLAT